ncbi:OmpA/MotB family protein [Humisphaera borealis]|uniref:OmpA family protein n=1 Tax=Humisphaera borealis TaxID=2807512 RepID=A0A7M2WPT7_9BACT|nr:OmpA family protein [Humisphaera borealis]QOV87419.1 OmpA family protein [Humisphaera borealis]
MARMHHFAVLGLSFLALGTGCVSSEKYQAQRMRAEQSDAQLSAAEANLMSANAKAELTQGQVEKLRQYHESQETLIRNQGSQITELTRQLEEMNGKYQLAMSNIGKAGTSSLPIQLVSELTTFAQQNPDVVEFDEAKGLVKFKSDVTFSAGSAVVKPEAKTVIDKLAAILNGPMASQHELLVCGHTDNVPVSNPVTKKNGHLDNWYLSAHRAIAVSQELRTVGVQSNRMMVAGYADQKPVAANDSDANKARNRRVEVFILPTTVSGTPAPIAPSAPVTMKPVPAKPSLNKDITPIQGGRADVDRGAAINK